MFILLCGTIFTILMLKAIFNTSKIKSLNSENDKIIKEILLKESKLYLSLAVFIFIFMISVSYYIDTKSESYDKSILYVEGTLVSVIKEDNFIFHDYYLKIKSEKKENLIKIDREQYLLYKDNVNKKIYVIKDNTLIDIFENPDEFQESLTKLKKSGRVVETI
ncbi:hypothetical protein [Senegalia massiliensis]|uniref:Uncharacterized protein n=1 Tax=Senegalia massiliensis TaxID=1720316 RepID=A0A845QXE1_9CLOT|nr:hypothetical protein [Senegalia massiliensis]NBI07627.1 hypothetical protein [Senegalia massiliensis]